MTNRYKQILETLLNLSKSQGIRCSLSNITKLCEFYNHPETAYPTIHVAGTNGKGSVCTKIAASLSAAGYRTGLYTSPHISTFRERIRIDGQMIEEEEFSKLFEHVAASAHIPVTLFESATLIAFLYFRQKKVDVAVIETGMGGTWDATNVVAPLVSVITSIGYDHAEILGPTLEDIARQKAGIIKENRPVVTGPDVPFSLLETIAREKRSPIVQSQLRNASFDKENQEIARLALQAIAPQFPVSNEALAQGLKAMPMCRFEIHQREKTIVLDVAHNGHGFTRLIENLRYRYPEARLRFVVGFSKGKDIAECARLIEQAATAIHLVSAPHPRLATPAEIAPFFGSQAIRETSVAEALSHALSSAACETGAKHSEEIVVVAGSFFLMQEVRSFLGIRDPVDPCLWYDPCKVMVHG